MVLLWLDLLFAGKSISSLEQFGMHLVIIENKFLVDFSKKVRMRHQNVISHQKIIILCQQEKIQVGWLSKHLIIQGSIHLLQTHSAALVNGSEAFPAMMKRLEYNVS